MVRGDSELLVCGTINWDTLLFVQKLPTPGGEIEVQNVATAPGGKGANTAVSAARILGPARVGLLATLGTDEIARRQIKELRREGVVTTGILTRGTKSGSAFVLVDGEGQDMILTNMGANGLMTANFLSKNQRVSEIIQNARVVVITDPPLDASLWIARQAKKRGAILVLSPALLTSYGLERLRDYLLLADFIIINEQEAAALLDSDKGSHSSATLSRILGESTVIVTLGNRGCAISSGGKNAMVPTIDLSSLGLKVVSTAGAGDAFVGTFAAFKIKGLQDIHSVFRANISAALKTTKSQIRGSPRLQQIERFAKRKEVASILREIRFT